jgi:DNA repair protein RadC
MSCIKDWPMTDRQREKLLSSGPATLSDSELLSLSLWTGYSGSGNRILYLDIPLTNESLR